MQSFIDKFARFYRMVCVIILSIMVLIVFVNAILRYTLSAGFIATEEILRYLFIYLTFLGVVEVACNRGHIAVTILSDAIKGRARTALHLLGYVLMLYALYVLLDGSIMYYEESATSVGQVTGLPFRVIIASLIFGAIGVLVFTLRDLYLGIKAFARNEEFPPRLVDEDLEQALKVMEENEKKEAQGKGA